MMWSFTLLLVTLANIGSLVLANQDEAASYYLYTPLNIDIPQQLVINDVKSVQQSNFDAKLPTKIIIHGWTMSYLEIPNKELRTAYQFHGDYNIISIDWSDIAALNYVEAKRLAPNAGASCGAFLQFMVEEFGLDLSQVVVIGHSMGAHIAGFCGKELEKISNGKLRIGHIVALDPAFPLYLHSNEDGRLNENDADNVVCLHTNGLLKGQMSPMGHADFYANGGSTQPGCGSDIGGGCAHARAVHFFAEAVKRISSFAPYAQCNGFTHFMLTKGECDGLINNVVELGDPLNVASVSGIFAFKTSADSPYGQLL